MTGGSRTDRPAYWVWGLVLGVGTALLLAIGGILGLAFGLVAWIGGWRISRSVAFGSGLLVGISGTWLALIARVVAECPAGSPDCYVPDQTPWLIAFGTVLLVGTLVGVIAWQRARSVGGASGS